MMLQPSKEVLDLEEQLRAAKTHAEKDVIMDKLREVLLKEREALKDCPLVH